MLFLGESGNAPFHTTEHCTLPKANLRKGTLDNGALVVLPSQSICQPNILRFEGVKIQDGHFHPTDSFICCVQKLGGALGTGYLYAMSTITLKAVRLILQPQELPPSLVPGYYHSLNCCYLEKGRQVLQRWYFYSYHRNSLTKIK